MAGRPAAPRQITQFVMPAVQLSAVDITPRELYGVMRDKYEWLQWRGYQNVGMINNGIYQHAVIVHANEFVDPVHSEIHTETIEGLWMLAKRKLRYQSGTCRGLFASYLSAFQWRNSHKNNVFGNYMQLISANYNI
jgi:hypothetical protein